MNGPFDRKRAPLGSRRNPSAAASAPRPAAPTSENAARQGSANVSRSEEDEARSSSKYRAALEALFAPKPSAGVTEPVATERLKKVVSVPSREDPRGAEREKRLAKLMAAEGRAAVTKAADDYAAAGLEFPLEQEVMLKLLDHAREERVRGALEALGRLLEQEPPQRRTVLEARLRRLADDADEEDVRTLAASLRKQLLSRPGR